MSSRPPAVIGPATGMLSCADYLRSLNVYVTMPDIFKVMIWAPVEGLSKGVVDLRIELKVHLHSGNCGVRAGAVKISWNSAGSILGRFFCIDLRIPCRGLQILPADFKLSWIPP